jgi:hypothetical protein
MDGTLSQPAFRFKGDLSMKDAEIIGISRRHFAIGGLSAGAALLAPGAVFAEGIQPPPSAANAAGSPAISPGTNTSFGPLKQIDAGLLNIGYAEAGPAEGPRSSFCTGGPMTFTALSTSPLCWQRRATG